MIENVPQHRASTPGSCPLARAQYCLRSGGYGHSSWDLGSAAVLCP